MNEKIGCGVERERENRCQDFQEREREECKIMIKQVNIFKQLQNCCMQILIYTYLKKEALLVNLQSFNNLFEQQFPMHSVPVSFTIVKTSRFFF